MKVLKFILKRKCPNETFDDNDFADLIIVVVVVVILVLCGLITLVKSLS